MVQIGIVTSIVIVALLGAPVISTPLPAETLDVSERDMNVLQSRQFGLGALFSLFSSAKGVVGGAARAVGRVAGKSGRSRMKMSKAEKKISDHERHKHSKKPQRYVMIGGMVTRRKRDILDMEERGWDYYDSSARGYLDELD